MMLDKPHPERHFVGTFLAALVVSVTAGFGWHIGASLAQLVLR